MMKRENLDLLKYATRNDEGIINGFVENEFIKKYVKEDIVTYLIKLNEICYTTVDFYPDGTPHKYNEDIEYWVNKLINTKLNC